MIRALSRLGRGIGATARAIVKFPGHLRDELRAAGHISSPPPEGKPMATVAPVVNVNVSALVRIGLDFLVRSLVRKSDPTAQTAAANTTIEVCQDILGAWNDADPTSSLTDLAGVIFGSSATEDPATADAIKTFILTAVSKVIGLHDELSGTLTDTLIGNVLNEVLGQVIEIAQSYLPATPASSSTPAPAAAPVASAPAAKSRLVVGTLTPAKVGL